MSLLLGAAVGILSFITYTLLRGPDERSTMQLSNVIDLQKHEVNPTITWLSARIGLPRAMRLTWIVIASLVALGDAYINMNFPYGVPVFALVIGFGHILAAGNNKHVAYVVEKMGAAEFEKEHDERMRELARLSLGGKLRLIYKSNPTLILMLVVAYPLAIALGYSMVATELFTVIAFPVKLIILPLNVAFCFVIAMLVIQPAFALAPLILSRRYSKSGAGPSEPSSAAIPASVDIRVPLGVIEKALAVAKKNGEGAVKVSIPVGPDSSDPRSVPGGGE